MMAWIARQFAGVQNLPPPIGTTPPPEVSPPLIAPTPARPRRKSRVFRGEWINVGDPRSARGDSPVWSFRDTLLSRLDEYFICIRRLRRHDPDAYGLFKKLGFIVAADRYLCPDQAGATAALHKIRSGVGGLLFGGFDLKDPDKKWIYPSFAYYRRLRQPPGVQRTIGDIYSFNVLFDDRVPPQHRKHLTSLCGCHIAIPPTGQPTLLRERVIHSDEIVSKRKRPNGRRDRFTRTSTHWGTPEWLVCAASQHNITPEQWATGIFKMVVLTHNESVSRFVIRVRKENCVAAFGIELDRAKVFFRDRDKTIVAKDGRRKRIFHSVTAHTRDLGDHITDVRAHFRGLRTFPWRGYGVHIVLPEHAPRMHMDVTAHVIPKTDPRHYLDGPEVGQILANVLEQ